MGIVRAGLIKSGFVSISILLKTMGWIKSSRAVGKEEGQRPSPGGLPHLEVEDEEPTKCPE